MKKTVDRLGKRVYTYYYVKMFKKADGNSSKKYESPAGFDSPFNGRN
jgi:hypothetical protein